MKIYFAGSITGGRQDQALYLEAINLLSNYGEVLTEHIGDAVIAVTGETIGAEAIFKRDVAWLEQSDVVVAEVTQVSMGVGYELGIAEKLGKKVLCLYRPSDKRISAMIAGNSKFKTYPYTDRVELTKIFDQELR